jgi:hypothetical protein
MRVSVSPHRVANDEPFSKDRATPKVANVNDTTFDAMGWSLKDRTAAAKPMIAVPIVQNRETFAYDVKSAKLSLYRYIDIN